ncbi:unnamed protein product [Clavelina lepadiformis]|uniref:Neutral ceramidase n=1 Tax=Clavelina lepadiformis TaxID=159417 RepID=A0ABP0FK64_CLALP
MSSETSFGKEIAVKTKDDNQEKKVGLEGDGKSVSRKKVIGWKIFLLILTIAIIVTIGVTVGIYANHPGNEKEVVTEPNPTKISPTTTKTSPSTTGTPLNLTERYYVGVGRTDVTGPIVQVNMMGYAHPEQKATGLHTRLYSRAFVIADENMTSRVAFVSFDGGMTSQLIKLEVVKRLKEKYGSTFTEQNVVISGTHTHSGPAGFFQYLLFEVTSLGHVQQSTDAFIDGIYESIVQANSNLKEATIKLGSAEVDEGNINRSPTSYLRNPQEERDRYTKDTEQEQVLLRFDTTKGEPLGMIAWYPVHPTNMNFTNTLINSDNKGRASTLFERSMRKPDETVPGTEGFVAAFAQSNQGDVSPRTKGPICIDTGEQCDAETSTCSGKAQNCIGFGPGKDMFESTDIIAKRQLAAAQSAYVSANEVVRGPVSWIHQYVNMSDVTTTLDDGSTVSTCKPGLGYSFAAGCTDGSGAFDFTQGMTDGTRFWDLVRDFLIGFICTEQPPAEYYTCHEPKPVLLPTGYMDKPYQWHPEIVDLQLLRIGQLVIAAVPGEFSTMAGRRLREMIENESELLGMAENPKVVIAGLSNVYVHYITTPEEYAAQRYEAASTIHGPHTFQVYQNKFKNLIQALAKETQDEIEPGPKPESNPANSSRLAPVAAPDSIPPGVQFGDVIDDVNVTYKEGDVAKVKFYGANPRHNMKLGSTYLEVQQMVNGKWVTIATDADWSTKLIWEEKNASLPASNVTLFSALFDVIAELTGIRFDLDRAMELYEEKMLFNDETKTWSDKDKDKFWAEMRRKSVIYDETQHYQANTTSVESYVTIEWEVPVNQNPGQYRIVYHGDHMNEVGEITSFMGQSSSFNVEATQTEELQEEYYVGVARKDVTGPIVQVNMMGYAHPEQIATGLHTRLHSRAFVVADKTKTSRVAFVSFDAGMASQLVKLEVVKRLQEKYGEMFTERNVVISGTHTHSGPAGFFQYLLLEFTSSGHIKQSTDAFVNGIVESIEVANSNLQLSKIKLGSADVDEGNINRSPTSYLRNPQEERDRYSRDTDQEQIVLRFDTVEGEPLGMIAWYPVHPTNMNFTNTLINSDNKGRASTLFERSMRKPDETVPGTESFIAAFAQSNQGDVSPRTKGPKCIDTGDPCDAETSTCDDGRSQKCWALGPGKNMFDSTDIIARRQLTAAQAAYDNATDVIKGPIGWVHQYVNMSDVTVTLDDGTTVSTCAPGMGYSFAAGTTDGAGAFDFTQGMTRGTAFWNTIRDIIVGIVCTVPPPDAYYDCHGKKPVLLPTGYMDKPREWHPSILDIQMLKIGQLIIAAVPGEFSTMAGRRFKETIKKQAVEMGMPENTKVVIAGLSNVYVHYITTPEEYAAQRYEAASTIHGPHTFQVYQNKFKNLIRALAKGTQDEIEPGPKPESNPANSSRLAPVAAPDSIPPGVQFGDVIDDVNVTYKEGDVAKVKFYGANPRHNMKLGSTYLEVQQMVNGKWVTIATDADWSTKLIWEEKNASLPASNVTLFSALFDVIAELTGIRFDLDRAMELYEEKMLFNDETKTWSDKNKDKFWAEMRRKSVIYDETQHYQANTTSVESYVTIEWEVPVNQNPGQYRIVYHGDHMNEVGEITSFMGQSSSFNVEATQTEELQEEYYVGVARKDVTGPIVQVNMMGYAHPEQIATGLHTRLHSRAFVIADKTKTSRVAFVSFDAGMASQLVKLEVVKRLQEKYGEMFTERNVVISGTHTHSGPAGFFQYLLFEFTSLGHVKQSTDAFVDGIVESIEVANSNLQLSKIKLGSADVEEGNINRSPTSYLRNPQEERDRYSRDTEQEQIVLRFDTVEGEPLGMIAWYPVHPTNMNFTNTLINSDNKGRASTLFERSMRKPDETVPGTESFIAAFAQSNQGDVSPRTKGPKCTDTGDPCDAETSTCNDGRSQKCLALGPGNNMFDSTDIIARRQLTAAQAAYDNATDVIKGPIGWVHQYVNMSDVTVTLDDGTTVSTCLPGMGYSFAAGTTDGAGAFDFTQGMTRGTAFWNRIRDIIVGIVCTVPPPDAYYDCHGKKPVLLPTGYMDKPREWHPSILDIQMLKIGQLIIAAVPGEFSTMAGRRFKETIKKQAVEMGMPENTKVVIAGLSNVYVHYITTPEEYAAQRYEAASTIHGPHTFQVYQQKYKDLVKALATGVTDSVDPGPFPESNPANTSRFVEVAAPDSVPTGVKFGDVIDNVNVSYTKCDVVRAKFYGANPRHNMKLGSTYLEIQRLNNADWVTVYTDADWSTKFHWEEKVPQPPTNVTLFSTLFDVIADVTGVWFDFDRAMALHVDGKFLEGLESSDVMDSFISKSTDNNLLGKLRRMGLIYAEPKPAAANVTSVESYVTIEWEIPQNQTSGTYRMVYHGDHMSKDEMITPFTGMSMEFVVN